MANAPVFRVDGARQLRSAMRAAGADFDDLTDANRQVAAIVESAGVATAPRRTGALAVSVRLGATKTQAVVRAGGSAVPYAGVIHWGWPRRHITAQPWLSTSAQQTESTWLPIYQRLITNIIDKVGRTRP